MPGSQVRCDDALLSNGWGEENPRRALPDSSSEGGGCLEFFWPCHHRINPLFFGEDSMQAGMAFFLNLCKKWMQFARFFFKVWCKCQEFGGHKSCWFHDLDSLQIWIWEALFGPLEGESGVPTDLGIDVWWPSDVDQQLEVEAHHTVVGWFVWLWLAKKKLKHKNLRHGFLGGVISRTFCDFHLNSWGDVKIWGIFCNCVETTMVRSVAPSEVLKLPKGMMMPQLPNPSGYLISPCLLFTLPPIIMFQLENGCTYTPIWTFPFTFFGWVFQPLNHDEMGEQKRVFGICLTPFENVTSLGWSMFPRWSSCQWLNGGH